MPNDTMDIEIGGGIYSRDTGPAEVVTREGASKNRKWVAKDGIQNANVRVNREVKFPDTLDVEVE